MCSNTCQHVFEKMPSPIPHGTSTYLSKSKENIETRFSLYKTKKLGNNSHNLENRSCHCVRNLWSTFSLAFKFHGICGLRISVSTNIFKDCRGKLGQQRCSWKSNIGIQVLLNLKSMKHKLFYFCEVRILIHQRWSTKYMCGASRMNPLIIYR